ncbi:DUF3299 domain-containing protein [Ferrimonas aestuarii]|uniref:DUF3299 domain-containing protein n=1 Tax=Ferrimonas aestuarii TaxID=2569539 RepID=A0A4U1BU32_9GAMM|nr:DUF3299 domain-containing protein [Ferrimonas aestuarii]TKB57535.1 DUF3299 domain-containing protein [Ferrimonas aestuarii]
MSIVLASLTLVFSCASVNAAQYREVAWVELMPADDLDALLNPPESIFDIQDGSSEDTLDSLGESEGIDEQRYFEALASTRVVSEFDNTKIKIPGFVVPLEMKEGTTVTEFLLVPFFGACLHQPPPPPNQIVYVSYAKGIELNSYQDAFWLEGKLTIKTTESDMGTAAYELAVDNVYPYTE